MTFKPRHGLTMNLDVKCTHPTADIQINEALGASEDAQWRIMQRASELHNEVHACLTDQYGEGSLITQITFSMRESTDDN